MRYMYYSLATTSDVHKQEDKRKDSYITQWRKQGPCLTIAICNSYTMGKRDLPDIYAQARGPQAYISGKSRVPIL